MPRARVILLFILIAIIGCGNHSDQDALQWEEDLPAFAENPPVVEKTVPASVFGATLRARDLECLGDTPACNEPNDCAPGHLDEPDPELEAGGGFFDVFSETWASITKPVDDMAKTFGQDVTLELSAYNAAPGYRIDLDCENGDGTIQRTEYAGGTAVDMHTRSCRLETSKGRGKFAFRLRRMSDNGMVFRDIEATMAAPSPLLPSTWGLSEGVSSVELEGGLRLFFAYFTPGTQSVGFAGNRRVAAMYLTWSRDDWMKNMPAPFADLPLRQWVLPGSHDAGMYTAQALSPVPVVSTLSVTQAQTTFEQLRLGVRYFDVRPGWVSLSGLSDDVYAVHTVIAGARYDTMLDDALKFLTEVGRDEIVIFHKSSSGIIWPWKSDHPLISAALDRALARRSLPKSFVGNELSLNLSPAELRKLNQRFILLDDVAKESTWGDANDKPESLAGYLARRAGECTSDVAKSRAFVTELQAQATAPHAIVNTLLGNKLLLDRSYFPWLMSGITPCATGPTVILNDFVDNGLTDVIARGQARGESIRDEWSKNEKPGTLAWHAGKLDWRGVEAFANRDFMLAHGAGGDLSVYRLARDPSTGAICNRLRVWTAPGTGDRVAFQSDGNLVLYAGDRAQWATGTDKKGGENLYLDARGELSVQDHAERLVWRVDLRTAGNWLTCSPPPTQKDFSAGTLEWQKPMSFDTATHRLAVQADGNVVLYQVTRNAKGAICASNVSWASGTGGKGEGLAFDRGGNLVIRNSNSRVEWQSNTKGDKNTLRLGADGLSILRPGEDAWRPGEMGGGTTCTWRELDESAQTQRVVWDADKLATKGFQVLGATKDAVLTFERGELALYRVARGASGAVCRKKPMWRVGKPGDDNRVRFDAKSGLSIRDAGGGLVWSAETTGSRLVLQNDGLSLVADEKVVWSVPINDRQALSCTGG